MGSEYTCEISSEISGMIGHKNSSEQFDKAGHIDPDKFVINLNQEIVSKDEKVEQLAGDFKSFPDLIEGRCRKVFARIDKSTLSSGQDKRPRIKSAPIGFPKEEKYVNTIFQRCHLIGYHLLGKRKEEEDNKDANLKRIFTGTCFMNNVMYSYEKRVADYVKGTDKYVLYRVTPYFDGCNQLVYGVQMEAKFFNKENVEDKEKSFNVFVYNKQPGIVFAHATGKICEKESKDMIKKIMETEDCYVINKKTKTFHLKSCGSVLYMKRKHKCSENREQLIKANYHSCPICDPVCRLDVF